MTDLHVPVDRSDVNKAWKVYRDNHRLYGDEGWSGFYKWLDLYEPNWKSVITGSALTIYLPQSAASKIKVLANYEISYHKVLLKVAEAKHKVINEKEDQGDV